jgi:predicted solute-binding protein
MTAPADITDPQELNREILAAREVLQRANLGCVSYLNSRPLIYGSEQFFKLDHPAALARDLRAGTLQGALVPVEEILSGIDYHVVDGLGICSRGPVYSVALVHTEPLEDLRAISLTNASRTSRQLLRVLLREFEGLDAQITYDDADPPEMATFQELTAQMREQKRGFLVIGNEALLLRSIGGERLQYYDLGEAWTRHTGLPFVYAAWALRPDVEEPLRRRVGQALHLTAYLGLLNRNRLAHEQQDIAPDLAQRYLTEHIRYDLGDDEKAGIEKFRELRMTVTHDVSSSRD